MYGGYDTKSWRNSTEKKQLPMIAAQILARHWSQNIRTLLGSELSVEDQWRKVCVQFPAFLGFGLLVGAVIGMILERKLP